ncbi:MAG: TIGR00730 family Rossman fold protein [Bacteroidetes bacterium]|nr:TIGR00730 family Rossman fold protein [Bacteroidota bacterium]
MLKSILVYCGANAGNKPIYTETAEKLGEYLGKNKIQLVYGGGKVGLMGVVSKAVLKNGGYVLGIIPTFLDKLEVGNPDIQEMITVDTMHQRKALMEEKCDGVITLPGGFGSMDELFEILTWGQLGLHSKPVGILNINNFYDPLIAQLDKMMEEGFLKPENRKLLIVESDIETLIEKMQNYKAEYHPKWLDNAKI